MEQAHKEVLDRRELEWKRRQLVLFTWCGGTLAAKWFHRPSRRSRLYLREAQLEQTIEDLSDEWAPTFRITEQLWGEVLDERLEEMEEWSKNQPSSQAHVKRRGSYREALLEGVRRLYGETFPHDPFRMGHWLPAGASWRATVDVRSVNGCGRSGSCGRSTQGQRAIEAGLCWQFVGGPPNPRGGRPRKRPKPGNENAGS